MSKRCAAPGCSTGDPAEVRKRNILGVKQITLFRTPKSPRRAARWAEAVESTTPLTEKHFLCQRHFREDDILTHFIHNMPGGEVVSIERNKCMLKPNADPVVGGIVGDVPPREMPGPCSGAIPLEAPDNASVSESMYIEMRGRKSGKGIFVYESGTKHRNVNLDALDILKKYKLEPKGSTSDEDRQLRMVTRFVNEAVLCLQENIRANPLEGDVGSVFGLGFPPFTSGLFRWVDYYGAGNLVRKMEEFQSHYGEALKPCQMLYDTAADSNKKFHPQ